MTAQDEANHPFHFSWLLILCAFIRWKESPHTQFIQLRSGDCRGTHYANLWESSSPAKKKVNMIVFYEYYRLLRKFLQETPRISKEIMDTYDNRLDFMVDFHRIYLRPKRSKRDDWANGWFRMTVQDVTDVIKDFDDEWKQALEDTTAPPSGTA